MLPKKVTGGLKVVPATRPLPIQRRQPDPNRLPVLPARNQQPGPRAPPPHLLSAGVRTFDSGRRYELQCNIQALPNAGGYLLSGTDDWALTGQTKSIGYIMRLAMALNVRWVYRCYRSMSH